MQKETLTPPASVQMVGRDAAPAQLVHQDQTKRSSTNAGYIRHRVAGCCRSLPSCNRQRDKYQMRDSDIALDRVYTMLSEVWCADEAYCL